MYLSILTKLWQTKMTLKYIHTYVNVSAVKFKSIKNVLWYDTAIWNQSIHQHVLYNLNTVQVVVLQFLGGGYLS